MKSILLKNGRQILLLIILIIQMMVLGRLSEYFLDVTNLLDLSRHLAEAGIIACGMTAIIMTGGIDLSVGSLLGLCGIVLGYTWKSYGPVAAISAALLTGAAGGALNGFLVARWKLPALVVTLATMALFRGLAMAISKAQPFSGFPESFTWLGQGELFPNSIPTGKDGFRTGLPVQLAFWIGIVTAASLIISRTSVGRYLAAIGDNSQAARYAALPVSFATFGAYAVTGLLCAVASLIFSARVSTAKADAGTNLELEVITAVVLGGTAITGGKGTIIGSTLGIIILGFLRNGLSLAQISSVYQMILAGAVLISVAILNQWVASRNFVKKKLDATTADPQVQAA